MPKLRKIWCTRCRCCEVEIVTGCSRLDFASACSTGAILMASGRVPTMTATRFMLGCQRSGPWSLPTARLMTTDNSLATLPQIKVIQRDDDERMPDATGFHQRRDLVYRHEARDQIFASIQLHAIFERAVLHEHGECLVGQDGRVGEYLADQSRICAFIAGFLSQL